MPASDATEPGSEVFNLVQPPRLLGTYHHRIMIGTALRVVTRPRCFALVYGAAILCFPPAAHAEHIMIRQVGPRLVTESVGKLRELVVLTWERAF